MTGVWFPEALVDIGEGYRFDASGSESLRSWAVRSVGDGNDGVRERFDSGDESEDASEGDCGVSERGKERALEVSMIAQGRRDARTRDAGLLVVLVQSDDGGDVGWRSGLCQSYSG